MQIVHRGRAPMGLSVPCGKERNRANEDWPLPARCGNRRDWAEMEIGPVCLAAKTARAREVLWQRGAGRRAACGLGA